MSCHGFHHLLVLLDDDDAAARALMERAIDLAELERARLTIAKATDPGRFAVWLAPLATLWRAPLVLPDLETARRSLDRATASVPASIPLTRVLLGQDTARALRELAESERYDLLIVRDGLIAHCRALRRAVRKLGLCTLAVCPHAATPPDLPFTATTTQEEVLEPQH
jgi:nucleotide-binding universal stress UspA family protein